MHLKVIILATVFASVAFAGPQHKLLEKRTEVNDVPFTELTLFLTQQLFFADTAADRFKMLPDDTQFVFSKGGDFVVANRKTFPALVGTSVSMAVGFFGLCRFNTLYVHFRAVELQIVVAGTVFTKMVPENGVFKDGELSRGRRAITNTLKAFNMQLFYQRSVHFQFNSECELAIFVTVFNNEDFGAGQVADKLFFISPEVVSAAFEQAIDAKHVAKFKGKILASIANSVEACLKKCKIFSKL
ncbi:hypothetical protein B0O99DRAFT_656751 [Bisporella sp. PMI_857]|nr:hypothetical protein B0O99DRAFT_656751 [Bisporella sp. PMI_857]